jgi:hypothetical protein
MKDNKMKVLKKNGSEFRNGVKSAQSALQDIQAQIIAKKEVALLEGIKRLGHEVSKEEMPQFFAERVFCITRGMDKIERFYLDFGSDSMRFICAFEMNFDAGKVTFMQYDETGKEE